MKTQQDFYLTPEQWHQAREVRRWSADQRMVRSVQAYKPFAEALIDEIQLKGGTKP